MVKFNMVTPQLKGLYALQTLYFITFKILFLRDDTEEIDVGIVNSEINEDSTSSPIQPKVFLLK